MERIKEIERSIIKKYRKTIWGPFVRAINNYELIQDGDKIMICISGGKDSFLLAKLLEEIKRHGKINFDLHFVVMNPGYENVHLNKILENAKTLNINIEVFKSDIFKNVDNMDTSSPCYMCARMRRGYLYNHAKQLGCNKIALGHHFDDVIETTLLSMFYGAEIKTMLPKLHSENYEGLELIRPMYLIREQDIMSWTKYNDLAFINCACKFTKKTEINEDMSKRKQMKKLINELRKEKKNIDYNIFKSLENININNVLGFKKNGKFTSFLDNYED